MQGLGNSFTTVPAMLPPVLWPPSSPHPPTGTLVQVKAPVPTVSRGLCRDPVGPTMCHGPSLSAPSFISQVTSVIEAPIFPSMKGITTAPRWFGGRILGGMHVKWRF